MSRFVLAGSVAPGRSFHPLPGHRDAGGFNSQGKAAITFLILGSTVWNRDGSSGHRRPIRAREVSDNPLSRIPRFPATTLQIGFAQQYIPSLLLLIVAKHLTDAKAEVTSLTHFHAMIPRRPIWGNHQAFLLSPIVNYGAVRLHPTGRVGP